MSKHPSPSHGLPKPEHLAGLWTITVLPDLPDVSRTRSNQAMTSSGWQRDNCKAMPLYMRYLLVPHAQGKQNCLDTISDAEITLFWSVTRLMGKVSTRIFFQRRAGEALKLAATSLSDWDQTASVGLVIVFGRCQEVQSGGRGHPHVFTRLSQPTSRRGWLERLVVCTHA